jgi:hypothetical protein
MTEASEKFTISVKPTTVARYAEALSLFGVILNVTLNRRLCKCIVKAYKQAAIGQAHALLRKARRLDTILHIKSDGIHVVPTLPEPECFRCHSQFSPSFYRVPETTFSLNGHHDTKDVWVCHKCHYEANESSVKSMGMNAS